MAAEHEPPLPDAQLDELVAELSQLIHRNEQTTADMREWLERNMVRTRDRAGLARMTMSGDLLALWRSIKHLEKANEFAADPTSQCGLRIAKLASVKLCELTEEYYKPRIERAIEDRAKRKQAEQEGTA